MRRTDREVTDLEEIKKIIESAQVLRLGLFDGDYPYVVPLHFGFEEKEGSLCFYMHSAKEGHKLDVINKNGAACLEIDGETEIISGGEVPCKYGATFSSLIARGQVKIVDEPEEKIHALKLFMKHQTGRDFEINEEMAEAVAVLKFEADTYSAKAKTK